MSPYAGVSLRRCGVTEAQAEETKQNDEIDWEEILLDGFDAGGHREEHEEREYYEPVSVERRDLDDHLGVAAQRDRQRRNPGTHVASVADHDRVRGGGEEDDGVIVVSGFI